MNRYSNEELAWLHLQDVQREAENRRLLAGAGASSTLAALRWLFSRMRAALQPGESRVEPTSAASAECRQEVA
jgi:hypothetical protein